MALKGPAGRPIPAVVEYQSRFCRGCGHDLVGLTGRRCPQCGRDFPALVVRPHPRGRDGRWLVIVVVGVGAVLALIGLKVRNMPPRQPTPGAGPTTLTSPG